MAKPLKADRTKKGKKANGAPPKATDGKAAEAAPTPGHNNRADIRASIQRTAFKKLWEIDREIAAERAAHIKPLQEERSEIWKTPRNDLDAAAADLKPLYSLYKRDREVREFDDEEATKKSQDMLREGFETLQQGETLDFLTVLGGGKKQSVAPEHIDAKTARTAGREAGRAGKSVEINPHAKDSPQGLAWADGWMEGTKENLPTGPSESIGSATTH